jgi:L-ascorbate metabolism protein UlaG (beta-lactamase superfamily)
MKITYNGHSCFTLRAKDGATVVTDPYEPGAFGGAIAFAPVREQPDAVTISHDHPDHNYVKGFAPPFVEVRSSATVKGIAFTAVATFHDEAGGRDRGKNTVFVIDVDGVRVCHLGDLGHRLTPAHMAAIGRVDVLLTPIGGTFTIDPAGATDAMTKLAARVTVPMHFKTKGCGFDLATLDDFLKGKGNVKRAGGAEVEFFPETLPGEPTVLVLGHVN